MDYKKHLQKDQKLKTILKQHSVLTLTMEQDVYSALCQSIISQQLSVKVARVIHQRFLNLFPDQKNIAKLLIEKEISELREIGLSNSKSVYIKEVAKFHLAKGIHFTLLHKMENEEVINYLTQIKGVGRWTVEMILMFTLGRQDVFAVDDLGIQQAMIKLYGLRTTDKKKLRTRLLKISESWIPYRTYACLHLWKWKDEIKK